VTKSRSFPSFSTGAYYVWIVSAEQAAETAAAMATEEAVLMTAWRCSRRHQRLSSMGGQVGDG